MDRDLIPHSEVLSADLEDGEFAAKWSETAVSRAASRAFAHLRAEHDLNQHELAVELGIELSVVEQIEAGPDFRDAGSGRGG